MSTTLLTAFQGNCQGKQASGQDFTWLPSINYWESELRCTWRQHSVATLGSRVLATCSPLSLPLSLAVSLSALPSTIACLSDLMSLVRNWTKPWTAGRLALKLALSALIGASIMSLFSQMSWQCQRRRQCGSWRSKRDRFSADTCHKTCSEMKFNLRRFPGMRAAAPWQVQVPLPLSHAPPLSEFSHYLIGGQHLFRLFMDSTIDSWLTLSRSSSASFFLSLARVDKFVYTS